MFKLFISFGLVLFLFSCQDTSTMESYTYRTKDDSLSNGSSARSDSSITYLALGDSYTIGHSVRSDSSFPNQIYQRLKTSGVSIKEPKIIAQTGWTTDELQSAINEKNLKSTYDLVTLLIGVNNQYRGRDLDNYNIEFTELLQQAIELAGGETGRVIVISIPDWGVTPFASDPNREKIGKEIDEFNKINFTRAHEAEVHYVDVTEISRRAVDDLTLIAKDGLHPSAKMYALWADELTPLAKTILSEGK